MKILTLLFLSVSTSLVSTLALAQEETEQKPLSIEAEFGLLLTTGNSETESLKGKIDINHDMTRWKNNYILEGLSTKDEFEFVENNVPITQTQRTAEKYFASVQADYKLNAENKGLFVFASYEEDHFSGYDYQGTFAIGYSDRLFKTAKSRFDYSVGPGVSFTKTEAVLDENNMVVTPSEEDETGVIRVSLNYLYQISKFAKFTQVVSSDMAPESDKNTKTKSVTAISASINSSLALKAAYTVNYNTEVPPGIEHADTQTSITLVYSY